MHSFVRVGFTITVIVASGIIIYTMIKAGASFNDFPWPDYLVDKVNRQ